MRILRVMWAQYGGAAVWHPTTPTLGIVHHPHSRISCCHSKKDRCCRFVLLPFINLTAAGAECHPDNTNPLLDRSSSYLIDGSLVVNHLASGVLHYHP
jgi:hypothetical protein